MAFAERRGNLWRARWKDPDGKLDFKSGFLNKTDAVNYGRDQEAAIRGGTYVSESTSTTTVAEWVNLWFPAQDLEPSTLADYRNRIEVRILPKFGHRILDSLTGEERVAWRREMIADGYAASTADAACSLMSTILNDAIPRYIKANPFARRRGKGRKGLRRIELLEKTEKVWPEPFHALMIAERCAALTGRSADFALNITAAYTGMRWSELLGLGPNCLHETELDVHWKLYELNGMFYRGRPKDGSVRTIDLPPFLSKLLKRHLEMSPAGKCTCVKPTGRSDIKWCDGANDYLFLGPDSGHHRRSNYSRRTLRPAADGRYPASGKRPALPVLVDATTLPGRPLPPWPAAQPGELFVPPTGRGRPRIDGDMPFMSWLPVMSGLTPHSFRHGHQTWMDDAGISATLKHARMGHEMAGVPAIYSHITAGMRGKLVAMLEESWADALERRARLSATSSVPIVAELLAEREQSAPTPLPNSDIGASAK